MRPFLSYAAFAFIWAIWHMPLESPRCGEGRRVSAGSGEAQGGSEKLRCSVMSGFWPEVERGERQPRVHVSRREATCKYLIIKRC